MSMKQPACPFAHLHPDYDRLEEIHQTKELWGVTEAMRHLSHEDCAYPWKWPSAHFTHLLRQEITESFRSFGEYVDGYLSNHSIEYSLEQYSSDGVIDLSVMQIPEQKTYTALLTRLEEEYCDNSMISALMSMMNEYRTKHQCCYKDAAMAVMRNLMRSTKQLKTLPIDTTTREWLLLFSELQDKIYTKEQVQQRNRCVLADPIYSNAITLTHHLLLEYLRAWCRNHPERYAHTFYPLQEVCLKNDTTITANPRFLKVIATNVWPVMSEIDYANGNFATHTPSISALMQERKVFEQYIFWFAKEDDTVRIVAVEPKSCPAKKIVCEVVDRVIPLVFTH